MWAAATAVPWAGAAPARRKHRGGRRGTGRFWALDGSGFPRIPSGGRSYERPVVGLCASCGEACGSNIIRPIRVILWALRGSCDEQFPRTCMEKLAVRFGQLSQERSILKGNQCQQGDQEGRPVHGEGSFNKFSTADHRNHYFRPSCFGTHDQRAWFRLIADAGPRTLTGSDPYTWRLHRAMNRTRA